MLIENKKAYFDYEILSTLEAGISLNGAEAKSFFENRVTLAASFVRIIGGEFYLVNAKFTHSTVAPQYSSRSRKLLVHKREILNWESKIKEKKLAIIPISMYTTGRFIKIKIGLAKAKAEFDKRAKIKKHDIEREVEREHRVKI